MATSTFAPASATRGPSYGHGYATTTDTMLLATVGDRQALTQSASSRRSCAAVASRQRAASGAIIAKPWKRRATHATRCSRPPGRSGWRNQRLLDDAGQVSSGARIGHNL